MERTRKKYEYSACKQSCGIVICVTALGPLLQAGSSISASLSGNLSVSRATHTYIVGSR